MKQIGIVGHSAEGAGLCYLTLCREGQVQLGPHMHPEIVMSTIPMGLSMAGWESGDYESVGGWLRRGVERVALAGADFFIMPDNTAHLVLEQIVDTLPIPGIHIAEVVCQEIRAGGWQRAGLLGTGFTMSGPVYERALERYGLSLVLPDAEQRQAIHRAIFDELCLAIFKASTVDLFCEVIADLRAAGAQCVILGCTEIPLIITEANSPLPVLDSTRLLARYALREALRERTLPESGWIALDETPHPVMGR